MCRTICFATNPDRSPMIARAIDAKVPFSLVAADSVYGAGDDRNAAPQGRQGLCAGRGRQPCLSFLGQAAVRRRHCRTIAQSLPKTAWQRLSAGEGTKGPRLHDWAYLELADLDADEYNDALTGLWTRGLLIRRNIADGDLAFFSTWCPKGTPIEKLVTVEGHRWAIEDSFETAKNELGLDHNETRSWHGWHRHVSLVMLAFAMMATIRHQANAAPRPKKHYQTAAATPILIRWSIQEIRRIAISSHSGASIASSRLVALAASTSSRGTPSPPQRKNATVMLAQGEETVLPTPMLSD